MSDKIYQAISEDFIRRMRNWAKSGAGLIRSNGRISSIYSQVLPGGYRHGSFDPPVLMGEASDVDMALLAVPIRYRQAVQQFWRNEGRSLRWHAGHCRIGLNYETFEAWVIKGHARLQVEIYARSASLNAIGALNAALVANSA